MFMDWKTVWLRSVSNGLSYVKDPIVNTLGFGGHEIFVAAAPLCCYSMKAAIDNISMNGWCCVPIVSYRHTSFYCIFILLCFSDIVFFTN